MNVTALLAKDVKKEDPDLQSNQPSELLPDLEVKPDSRHGLYGRTLSPEPDMPLLTPELQPCSSIDKPMHNTDSHFRESHPNVAAPTQCISLNGMPELFVSIPLNRLDSLDEKTEMKSPDNRGPDDGGFVYSPISSVGSKRSSKVASAMCLSPISSCGSLTPDRAEESGINGRKTSTVHVSTAKRTVQLFCLETHIFIVTRLSSRCWEPCPPSIRCTPLRRPLGGCMGKIPGRTYSTGLTCRQTTTMILTNCRMMSAGRQVRRGCPIGNGSRRKRTRELCSTNVWQL